ncbi:MAG: enoyl-CoA hydratase/isomerase family protein [Actinomycetota bacterium]|nr:enoyl-CoA hydratase/isomerase family protein [Actinomycetota bacterium]
MSDLDVLTFSEARDFVKNPYVADQIHESEDKTLIVEIHSDLLTSQSEDFYAFAAETFSLNLFTVGLVTDNYPKEFATLLQGFDVLFSSFEDGVSVQVPELEGAAHEVSLCVRKNPQAAIVLAQVLRQEAFHDVPKGLTLESLSYSMLQNGPEFARWLGERGKVSVPPDENQVVLSSRSGNRLDISLNRPGRANAFSSRVRDELVEALQIAIVDESIDEITLNGRGNSFCSGGELAEFGLVEFSTDGHLTRITRNPGMLVHRLGTKIAPYLHGVCAGAGIEIPSFASQVVAHESTRIFLPEVAMGLIPGAGGTVSIPRRIGRQRTAFLAVTGNEITGEEALKWGLIDTLA